jgi:hypothetical protein
MSLQVSVSRSPLRLLGYAAFAVPAILLAVDMLFAYRWYPEPATFDQVVGTTVDANGQTVDVVAKRYTQDGGAQRRRDLFLGSALLIGGAAAMGWGLKELVRPTVLIAADDEGISARVGGPGEPAHLFPWGEIVEVRSGMLDDDGAEVPVLSLRVRDPGMIPTDPAGAEADPPWLHIFADEWDRPPHQVAPLLDQWASRPRPDGGEG